MIKKVVGFADGENLVGCYQRMLKNGRVPNDNVEHVPDEFVWSSGVAYATAMDVLRISYYTSSIKSQDVRDALASRIANNEIKSPAFSPGITDPRTLIPRVYKREADRKTRVVDIEITIDALRAALMMPIDVIFLLTGDSDFVSLAREVTRSTSKQIYLGAFSNGLAPDLRTNVDMFMDLDRVFFKQD